LDGRGSIRGGGWNLGVKRPEREADHTPPSSAEVKECMELYLHSSYTSSWRGAWLSTGKTSALTIIYGCINDEVLHYINFPLLLLLNPSFVKIFSSEFRPQTPSIYVLFFSFFFFCLFWS
jgi:hypothetical protein